jgi:mono/diheme cytochrome c family protein
MKTLLLLGVIALTCTAQEAVKHGEQVFAKTCATGYCHGVKGTSSGAPRLAGRGFTQAYINGVVTRGIEGTGMPSFATTLSKSDLTAVVAYVAALNGATPETDGSAAAPSQPALTGEALRGQRLFFDAVRGFGRCATCHEVDGYGISVATPIAKVPASAAALKALATPGVKTATMNGESMPVLMLSDTKQGALFYDLTSVPPVERNAEPGSVKFADGSSWRHASVMGAYNDAELSAILAYLRAAE